MTSQHNIKININMISYKYIIKKLKVSESNIIDINIFTKYVYKWGEY